MAYGTRIGRVGYDVFVAGHVELFVQILNTFEQFPHYFINRKIFGKMLFDMKYVFDFLYNFCLKFFSF